MRQAGARRGEPVTGQLCHRGGNAILGNTVSGPPPRTVNIASTSPLAVRRNRKIVPLAGMQRSLVDEIAERVTQAIRSPA